VPSAPPLGVVSTRGGLSTLARVPLWLALAGGAIEVSVFYARKRAQPLVQLSEDFVWMSPLALVVIALVCGVAGAGLARVWGPRRALAVTILVAAFAIWLDLLLLVPRLAHGAAALLAAGLALQTVRIASRHPDAVSSAMRRSTPWLLAGLAVGLGLMWMSLRPALAARSDAMAAGLPNVVIITLDTVRAANLSLYGYERRTTPHLDRFATRGVVFEHAFTTAPWTLPSHASLFTGRWPHELSTTYTTPLDATHPTLAEYFSRQGYRTAGFVANLGYCSHETGLGRGFQHYEDYPRSFGQIAASSTLVKTVADNFRLRSLVRNDQHLNRISATAINRRVLDWLSGNDTGPFFVFLNYFDAHEPYLPPPPFDQQFGPGRARGRHSPLNHWLWNRAVAHGNMGEAERREEIDAYDGALAYLDRELGTLLEIFEHRGLLDNTILIVTSDHGEEFGEHGVYDHGYSLYRAGLHVPLVIVAPDRIAAGRRIASPVSLRDLAATVVDLARPGESTRFPGTSLAPLWTSTGPDRADSGTVSPVLSEVETAPGQPDWFPSSKGPMKALTLNGIRYIRNGDGREELYDLTSDPWERENLISLPDRQTALHAARAVIQQLVSPSGP
jgi:arylsulfatase A-like enzyme